MSVSEQKRSELDTVKAELGALKQALEVIFRELRLSVEWTRALEASSKTAPVTSAQIAKEMNEPATEVVHVQSAKDYLAGIKGLQKHQEEKMSLGDALRIATERV
jgi:hypothetical protein